MAVYPVKSHKIAERLILLRDYIYEHASPSHVVKAPEMLAYLEKREYKVAIKTLYSDLDTLIACFGLDLQYDKRQKGYLLNNPPFEAYELRLIANSIQAAQFITQQEADRLTNKVVKLADEYTKPSLRRKTYIRNRVRTINEEAMQGLDAVYEAIAQDKKISYKYFKYTINKRNVSKKYITENDSKLIEASPYKVFWQDDKFWIYAIQKVRKDIYIERVSRQNNWDDDEREEDIDDYQFENMDDTGLYVYDFCLIDLERMEKIKVLDDKREGKEYYDSINGDEELSSKKTKLKVNNMYITDVLNKFGNEVSIFPSGHTFFIATINEEPTPELYMWTREFAPPIEIISPENAEDELKSYFAWLMKRDDAPEIKAIKEMYQAEEEFLSLVPWDDRYS